MSDTIKVLEKHLRSAREIIVKKDAEIERLLAEVERLREKKNCKHETALFDICEGDAAWRHGGPEYTVQWCPTCGAYRRNHEGEWREVLGDE